MKLEMIKRITEKYKKRLEEIAKEGNKETPNHFRHISAQLMSIMAGNKYLIDRGVVTWEEIRKDYLPAFITLKRYLGLLESFSDFKKVEITEERGAFPKVRDYENGGAQNYVDGAKRVLTRKNIIRKCSICGVIEREGVKIPTLPVDIQVLEEQGYTFTGGPLSKKCAIKYDQRSKSFESFKRLPESCPK